MQLKETAEGLSSSCFLGAWDLCCGKCGMVTSLAVCLCRRRAALHNGLNEDEICGCSLISAAHTLGTNRYHCQGAIGAGHSAGPSD